MGDCGGSGHLYTPGDVDLDRFLEVGNGTSLNHVFQHEADIPFMSGSAPTSPRFTDTSAYGGSPQASSAFSMALWSLDNVDVSSMAHVFSAHRGKSSETMSINSESETETSGDTSRRSFDGLNQEPAAIFTLPLTLNTHLARMTVDSGSNSSIGTPLADINPGRPGETPGSVPATPRRSRGSAMSTPSQPPSNPSGFMEPWSNGEWIETSLALSAGEALTSVAVPFVAKEEVHGTKLTRIPESYRLPSNVPQEFKERMLSSIDGDEMLRMADRTMQTERAINDATNAYNNVVRQRNNNTIFPSRLTVLNANRQEWVPGKKVRYLSVVRHLLEETGIPMALQGGDQERLKQKIGGLQDPHGVTNDGVVLVWVLVVMRHLWSMLHSTAETNDRLSTMASETQRRAAETMGSEAVRRIDEVTATLRRENTDLRDQLERATAHCNERMGTLAEVEEERDAARRQVVEIRREMEEMTKELDILNKKLRLKTRYNNAVKDELEEAHARILELETKRHKAESPV